MTNIDCKSSASYSLIHIMIEVANGDTVIINTMKQCCELDSNVSPPNTSQGFSLVELAIVLVILGLLVGGVLSGKSLIRAAEIRATLAQVDNIKVAGRTFRDKYFYLPGDIPTTDANRLDLGLSPNCCGPGGNAGNGNGVIDGDASNGEGNLFFVHASQKGLLSGSFEVFPYNGDVSGSAVGNYIMKAKLGNAFYMNVWSGGPNPTHPSSTSAGVNGINYISLMGVPRYCGYNVCGTWGGYATLSTMDAYTIDKKIDDGVPQSGDVLAFYWMQSNYANWAGGEYYGRGMHQADSPLPSTAANAPTSVNCYDNGGVAGVAQTYTVSLDNNTCGLSFKF